MKSSILLFFISAFCLVTNAQEKESLNSALNQLTIASTKGQAEVLLEHTSPRLIKVLGGKQNALKFFKKTYDSMLETGVTIDTVINYTKGPIYNIGKLKYLEIPQLIILNTKEDGKKMIGPSFLLAINETGNGPWTFLDYSNFGQKQIDILLPEFKGIVDLVNRPDTKPTLVDNTEVDNLVNKIFSILDKRLNL